MVVTVNNEPGNRSQQRSASCTYNSLCLMWVYFSLRGVVSGRKIENPCSNESVSKTLESPTVTSSLDTGTCSKSNAGNKFSRADKSWSIG